MEDIDLNIHKGDLITIEGPSGSGKTTLLNIISGFIRPQKGHVYFNQRSILWMPDMWKAHFRGKNFGYIFQDYRLLPYYSVWENLILPLYFSGKMNSKSLAFAKNIADRLGLENLLQRKPATLSGGEKQRVGIGRAIITNPSLVLADEPTGNLDKENAKNVKKLLYDFYNEFQYALVIVTHDASLSRLGKEKIKLKRPNSSTADLTAE